MKNENNKIVGMKVRFLIGAFALVTCNLSANAAELNMNFNVGAGHTDNLEKTAIDTIDESFGVVGTSLTYLDNTRTLDADIRLKYSHINYQDNFVKDQNVGAVDAFVEWSPGNGRFSWLIEENYGRQLFDPFEPARPENWENVNYLTTGPTLSVIQTTRNDLSLGATYSKTNYEFRPYDNDKYSGLLSFARSMPNGRIWSLNADAERVEFDNNGLSPDFDQYDAYLGFEGLSGRNNYRIDLGFTKLDIDDGQEGDGVLVRLNWIRTISEFSTLTVYAGTEYSDQGNIFRYMQDISRDIDSIGDVTEGGTPFRLDSAFIRFATDTERTTFEASVGYAFEDYEGLSDQNRKTASIDLLLIRQLTRKFYVRAETEFYFRQYESVDRDDDDVIAIAAVGYNFTPGFGADIEYAYISRESDDALDTYDENRVFLNFYFTPAWGRSK